jgi:hypothetical protein
MAQNFINIIAKWAVSSNYPNYVSWGKTTLGFSLDKLSWSIDGKLLLVHMVYNKGGPI